jgi:PAS domain S-box-containing protein
MKNDLHRNGDTDGSDLLRVIFRSVTDFAVFAMDREGQVISWNSGAERLTGFTEAEMVGHSGDIIFTSEDRAAGEPENERAAALVTGHGEDERWHLRRDGSRFWGSGVMMLLSDGAGFVKVVRDRTTHHEQERALRESEARFRMLATSIPQLVFRSMMNGDRTWGSPQWEIYAGLSDPRSRGLGWLDAVHPDDRGITIENWQQAQRTCEYYVEHRICRHVDGQYRWHQTRARPIADVLGEWVGTSTDIHDLRGLQDRQHVLVSELQHRTRNLLTLVQAIALQTAKINDSVPLFVKEFSGRLVALSRVQGLVSQTAPGYLDLRRLLEAELAAHGPLHGVSIEGEDIDLGPDQAQTLALALHELATNAAKYGALAHPEGMLNVNWTAVPEGDGLRLKLYWRETGLVLPADVGIRRKGYGRELIERALPRQMNGKTEFAFLPDGVRCEIEMLIAPASIRI